MTLIQDIQKDLLDPSIDASALLRKALILASRLGDRRLAEWLHWELDGYPKDVETPSYRQFPADSYGHFSGPFGSSLSRAPIPLLSLPREVHDALGTAHLRHSVSALSEMAHSATDGVLQLPWPPDLVAFVANTTEIYPGMNLLSAFRLLAVSSVCAVLETVKNRLLEIVLDIEKLDPNAGTSPGHQSISSEKASTISQTIIYGDVGVLSSGSGDALAQSIVQIRSGDAAALSSFIETIGLSEDELTQFKEALDQEEKHPRGKNNKGLMSWLGWMAQRIEAGLSGVAWTILADAVRKYLGL